MTDDERATSTVEGEAIHTPRISEGQKIIKKYKNCEPSTLVDEPGKYAIVRVADGE